jgi:hypothetical protein
MFQIPRVNPFQNLETFSRNTLMLVAGQMNSRPNEVASREG